MRTPEDLIRELEQRISALERSRLVLPDVQASGVVDHGLLTGLADDDHTQYHTDTRGDARYLRLTGGTLSGALTVQTGGVTVQAGGADVTGTVTGTTFSGSGASLTNLPAGNLTGTVASARISGAYTGITSVGTLGSLAVTGLADVGTIRHDYAGRITRTNVQSIPNNTSTVVTFGSETFDYAANHSTSTNTGRVTATVAGVYCFMAVIPWAGNNTGNRTANLVRYNSSNVSQELICYTVVPGLNGGINTPSGLTLMAVGDYVQVEVSQNSGAALDISNGFGVAPFLSWFLVRAT